MVKVTYFTHSGSDGENRDALLVDSVVAGADMPSCKQIYSASKLFAISDGIGREKYSKELAYKRDSEFIYTDPYAKHRVIDFD